MAFNIEASFDILPKALEVHERRAEIIANNLANQDSPGFKAQDLDFKETLQAITQQLDVEKRLKLSNQAHISNAHQLALEYVKYRNAIQPSLDGNTVDGQIEQSEFAENTMRYLANLNFLNGKIQGLMLAIRGAK